MNIYIHIQIYIYILVASLKLRIQELEKQEAIWKEKLKEEHTQLINFQKKLAQAGTHLKTLTQENASLTKSVTEQKKQQQEMTEMMMKEKSQLEMKYNDDHQTWTKKEEELKEEIKKMNQSHQKGIKQLVSILESTINEKDDEATMPDVSTPSLLDSYIKSLQEMLLNQSSEAKKPEKVRHLLQEQGERIQKLSSMNKSATEEGQKDLKRQITQLNMTINGLIEEKEKAISEKEDFENQSMLLETKVAEFKSKLESTEKEKKECEDREKQLSKEHQRLLGKISHIKETLSPRLEQDKQLRQRINELSQELETTRSELEQCRSNLILLDEEHSSQVQQLENTIKELSSKLESVHREREEYEMTAMQLDAHCNQLQEQLKTSTSEIEQMKTNIEVDSKKRESERVSLANLQTVLEEFQATKDAEIQAAVEHIERQLDVAKRSWAEYEERTRIAEASLEKYQQDAGKTEKFEKEIKEKNLLIGKLRHEAIILNEHLVEAMRKLKEETSENNVDRGDRKRFDILTIISNVLQLTEEQKEQIGLLRPKNNTSYNGQPTSPIVEQPQKESFTDAWISFLLKESNPLRRNRSEAYLPSIDNSSKTPEL
ncbi:uncharacterized protein BX663DRAFT_440588 [Cokeromyces recurvatus]|uniref:uncharacterized protein n=1 Tax=Cokeromyces recurvatus TaxID=90255 RepID=UPI00221E48E2|nr:uncharacterized protein BX663DRAFT_440588 [Cokeromyces recurvatus]KAI7899710.1 hypothetical protein BX663DRAFT_440588 [Cokeromyces recurvatus]